MGPIFLFFLITPSYAYLPQQPNMNWEYNITDLTSYEDFVLFIEDINLYSCVYVYRPLWDCTSTYSKITL